MSVLKRIWMAWARLLWAVASAAIWVAGVAILASIVVTLREVIGRYWFDAPTEYSYTFVSVSVVVILYFSLAYTATVDGHIASDVFSHKFPPRVKAATSLFGDLIAAIIGGVLASQTYSHLGRSLATNETIPELFHMPLAVAQGFVVFGALLLMLVSLTKVPHHIGEIIGGQRTPFMAAEPDGEA